MKEKGGEEVGDEGRRKFIPRPLVPVFEEFEGEDKNWSRIGHVNRRANNTALGPRRKYGPCQKARFGKRGDGLISNSAVSLEAPRMALWEAADEIW